jgi:flagellar hook-basal body complex protein FliE
MAVGPIDGSALSLTQPRGPLGGVAPFDGGVPLGEGTKPSGGPFSSLLVDAVSRANAADNVAHTSAVDLASGRTDDIHNTMIDAQKANIELKLVGSIRNKVVDAFYELWRMSV